MVDEGDKDASPRDIYKDVNGNYNLRRPDPISCGKWDVSYFMTLQKKITNFYVVYAAIYSKNALTNECWK